MKTFHRVVVAIDFTKHCRIALKEAAHRAAEDHSEVFAVHVMDEFLMEELKRAQSTDRVTIRKEWEQKLIHFIAEAGLHASTNIRVEVRIGRPFDELVEACRVRQADLLVMGAKGSRSDPNRIGVIAAKCIRHAPVDVLVVRQDAQGPFKRVIACVDFSENSAKAVQCALHIAHQDGASVEALFVYQSAIAMALDYGGMIAPAVTGADPEALANWHKDMEAFIAPLKRSDSDVPLKLVVKERVNIREAILDQVNETHADLVVLGTRGKSGLRELFIGTTAEKIIQNAPCSILAVKPDAVTAAID
jgi:nucleotide-binding universal stress UspA family protein